MLFDLNISIDLRSRTASLRDLLEAVGHPAASDGSHDKADIHPSGKEWGSSRLRIDSTVPDESPVAAHLKSLAKLDVVANLRTAVLPDDCEVVLNVAAFFDTPMAQIDISIRDVLALAIPVTRIEISTYPSSTDDA